MNFGNYMGPSGDSLKGPDKGSGTPNPGRRPSQETAGLGRHRLGSGKGLWEGVPGEAVTEAVLRADAATGAGRGLQNPKV